MKRLISKIQKDISHLQDVVHKEGNDLLEKIKHIDLKSNMEHTKVEIMKVLNAKMKNLEPTCHSILEEVRKNAKKAGIDIDKLEHTLKAKAGMVKTKIKSRKKTVKKKTKKTGTKAKPAKAAKKKSPA